MRHLIALMAVCLCAVAGAQNPPTLIPLKWADPQVVVAMLSPEAHAPPTAEELRAFRQQWVNDFAADIARRLPRDPSRLSPEWHHASSMTIAPREQVGRGYAGFGTGLLPAGLDGPPIAFMPQNAIIARGTPTAIDQLREVIAMLDVKPRMVNVECRMVDAPTVETDEWGVDARAAGGSWNYAMQGNVPPAGPQLLWRRGPLDVLAGWDRTRSRSDVLTAANITTTNNFPAVITLGRMMPYVTSATSYDPFGRRIVETWVDAIFIGTELFVQPRINADDSITMLIRPTFIEAVGSVIGPQGTVLPITETLGAETMITVRDGETLQLGGFERSRASYNESFGGLLRGRRVAEYSHPLLFVTPRIIRDLDRALP